MKRFQISGLVLVGMAVATTNASAVLVAPAFSSDDAITVGTAVITGLALIWGIKKAMSLAK